METGPLALAFQVLTGRQSAPTDMPLTMALIYRNRSATAVAEFRIGPQWLPTLVAEACAAAAGVRYRHLHGLTPGRCRRKSGESRGYHLGHLGAVLLISLLVSLVCLSSKPMRKFSSSDVTLGGGGGGWRALYLFLLLAPPAEGPLVRLRLHVAFPSPPS